ncbi:MAG: tetratricopeptide repeat protein [Acidobacteria bacterium]|nr:tetratricopeptide repeat protein [Acidobacteriota bacterium]
MLFLLVALLSLGVACTRDPNVAKKKYLDSGNRYYEKGKYKEALIMYRNALKKDMKYGEAYYRAALAELKLARIAEAARDLHRSVELQPDNLDAHTKLVNLYLNAYLNDRRRPKAYLNELRGLQDKLAKRHPSSYELQRLSGYLALTDQKLKDAINFFQKANTLKPMQPDIVLVLIQSLAGDNRFEEGEKLAFDMIQKNKSVGSVYDALFLEYLRRNRVQDAENILKQKVRNNYSVTDYHLQLAAHYFSMKRREEMLNELKLIVDHAKEFPRGPQLAGDFCLRIRDFDLALKFYQEGMKRRPGDKHMFQKRMIEALVLQGKVDQARQLLAEILKEAPQDNEAIAIRASMTLLGGSREQLQGAINDMQTVVSRMPENPVLRFNLGRAHLAKGNTQQAKIQFEEAIKLRPDYLLPRIALAQILVQQGDFGKVSQMAQEVLVYDPFNVPARLLRTRALIGMGETRQARAELGELIKKNPELWDARLQLAALDLAERNWKAAEETFRGMYEKTQDSRALMGLTETYVSQQNYDQAQRLLEAEIKRMPERVDYHVALGNVAARAQKYDLAIQQFKAVLEQQPRATDTWIRLGETQRRAGQFEAAVASFSKARELAPNNVIPHLQLALLLDGAGQKERAKPLYEQILKLQPDNAVALNNLAYMMAENGLDLDQALTMAQRAKQKMPQDLNVSDTLGWIYIKKNLSDSAIAIYRELVRQDPDRTTFRYHLAMALMQKGDKPGARKELELALAKKPPKDEEAKIRALMGKI